MFRFLLSVALFVVVVQLPAQDDEEKFVISPRTVKMELAHSNLSKVTKEMTRQTGIAIRLPDGKAAEEPCDGIFNGKPFWFALEFTASQTGNRIVLHDSGRKIALEPRGKSYEVSSVHGPFRVAAREVVGRLQLDTGTTFHELHLDIHWEPRFPVFRLDSTPRITKATDDKGKILTVQSSGVRGQPTGAMHPATVRLGGLTRESKRIAKVEGNFTVAASEKMLAFTFDDLTKGKSPVTTPTKEKVAGTLKRVEKDEKSWEFEVELNYPAIGPKFESFESWTHENRLRLVSPEGAKSFTTEDFELLLQGSKVVGIYRFKEDDKRGLVNPASKGWKLIYEAPSTPVEFNVPFELKDIPLP